MSNLQTLLDAAKFVECTNTPDSGARAPDPPEFHHYAKPAISRKRSNSGSDKSDQNDDSRDRKRYGGAGTREVHNILEKNRRAHLKECFDGLKLQVPNLENHTKVSNLSILRGAYRYILVLKRHEKELEQELQQLALMKIQSQHKISSLHKDLNDMNIAVDISNFLPPPDEDTRSVSTATAHDGSPIMSEDEDVEIGSPDRYSKFSSNQKPALNFCNVIVTSPMKLSPVAPAVYAAAMSTPSTQVTGPVFTIRGYQTTKAVHAQSSTVGSNRTIAAMLSTTSQSVANGVAGSSINSRVSGIVAGSTNNNNGPQSVSLVANSLSTLMPSSNDATTTATQSTYLGNVQITDSKASVNQLLQQTIAQRVQLQQLAKQQQQLKQQQSATIVVATSGNVTPTINVRQLTGSPQVISMNTTELRPVLSGLKAVSQLRPTVALNHVLPSTFTLNTSTSVTTTRACEGATVSISQPITLATLNQAPVGSGMATVTTLSSTTMPQNALSIINQIGQLTTGTGNVSMPINLAALQTLNLAGIKPILTVPIAQLGNNAIVTQQVTTLQQLMSQAVAKSNAFRGVATTGATMTTTFSTSSTTMSPAVTQLSTLNSAGVTSIPACQFLPLNIVSPSAGQPSSLNQINLSNTGLSPDMLKSLGHIPILQQPINLPVNPLVMVTVANAVPSATQLTAANTRTIQVNIPVTHS